MKNFYLTLVLVAFASFLFVKCDSDDDGEVIEEVDPFDAEGLAGGASGVEILTENTYTSLTIEFAYVEGHGPSDLALTNLRTFLEQRIYKSGGINFVLTAIPVQSGAPYSVDALLAIEREYRTKFRSETDIALWCLYVNENILEEGDDGPTTNIDLDTLAAVYFNTSMYMSRKAIESLAELPGTLEFDAIEASTLQHEFGHFFSLVNIVGDDIHPGNDHESTPDFKGHCKVENCLMFYASDGTSLRPGYIEVLRRGNPAVLDPLCIADLVAKGGRK